MPSTCPSTLFDRIRAHLDALLIPYQTFDHEPTRTSEESAVARGSQLGIGAKALFVKHDAGFVEVVIPANCQLDWKLLKQQGIRGARFATADELTSQTGLEKGSVPPLLNLLGFEVLVDPGVIANDRIQFNAGSLTSSIEIAGDQLLRASAGRQCQLAKTPANHPA
ncbi:MAG: hypothetical protein JWR83_233 [Aeromicrobium sp.]|nr:hypothetical protein [Aeromicrobium sp.]